VETFAGVDIVWLVIGSAIGLALGFLRGWTVRVFEKDGVLWQRYTPWTLLVWAVSMALNAGVGFLAVHTGAHPEARPMTLSIGVGLVGELIPVGLRALRSGIPFAPERART
jgi:ABC-type dipeptide/oligopeptide/nickel transport system permease subunit